MNNNVIDTLIPRELTGLAETSTLNRRRFLNGAIGAAGLSLFPLLNQVASADTLKPRRFVFFVEGNGTEPITMLSPTARNTLNNQLSKKIGGLRYWSDNYRHKSLLDIPCNDLDQAKSLGALSSLKDRATVIYGLTSKISGGGHSNFHGCLSCTKTSNRVPGGPTIDAVLANHMAGQTPFDAVRVGVINSRATLDFGVTALKKGKASPVVMSPSAAKNIYFSRLVNTTGFNERSKILDTVQRGIDDALKGFPTGPERIKLENYAESIQVLAARQQRLSQHPFDGVTVPDTPDTDDPLLKYEQQVQLATATLIGGLTNVAVLPIGTSGEGAFDLQYKGNYNVHRHALHHSAETKTGDGGGTYADKIHQITGDQIGYMTAMAQTLADTPDVDGNDMLTNTVLVYIPDTGDRHHSKAVEWPVLMMGGENLGLKKGGRTLVYPGIKESNHRQVSNLWNTLGHLAGLDLNEFGSETEITRKAKGPLSDIMS